MKEYVRNSIAALQSSPYVSEVKTSVVLGGEYRFEWRYKGSDFMDVYTETYNVAAHAPEQIVSMCDNALSAIPV